LASGEHTWSCCACDSDTAATQTLLPLLLALLPLLLALLALPLTLLRAAPRHLGFYQRAFTPLARGFDEHMGYFQV